MWMVLIPVCRYPHSMWMVLIPVCRDPHSMWMVLIPVCRYPHCMWMVLIPVHRDPYSMWMVLIPVCRDPHCMWMVPTVQGCVCGDTIQMLLFHYVLFVYTISCLFAALAQDMSLMHKALDDIGREGGDSSNWSPSNLSDVWGKMKNQFSQISHKMSILSDLSQNQVR